MDQAFVKTLEHWNITVPEPPQPLQNLMANLSVPLPWTTSDDAFRPGVDAYKAGLRAKHPILIVPGAQDRVLQGFCKCIAIFCKWVAESVGRPPGTEARARDSLRTIGGRTRAALSWCR